MLFRHEKTFFHPAAVMVRVQDTDSAADIAATAKAVAAYNVDYVGISLMLNGLVVEASSGNADQFAAAVAAAAGAAALPLVLVSEDPAVMAAGLAKDRRGEAADLRCHRAELGSHGQAGQGTQGPTGSRAPRPCRSWPI